MFVIVYCDALVSVWSHPRPMDAAMRENELCSALLSCICDLSHVTCPHCALILTTNQVSGQI